MEPKGEENLSLDNWHKKADDLLSSAISNNPVEWLYSWNNLGIASLGFLLLALFAYQLTKLTFFEMFFQFTFFSLIPAAISLISYINIRSTIQKELPEKQHEIVSKIFLRIGITGLIILFFMNAYISLSRLDCGLGCVKPVWVDTISAGLFFILWVLLPFYFWWKAKKVMV